LTGRLPLRNRLFQQQIAEPFQPRVHADAEGVLNVELLAGVVHRGRAEAAVASQMDMHVRPCLAQTTKHILQIVRLDRAVAQQFENRIAPKLRLDVFLIARLYLLSDLIDPRGRDDRQDNTTRLVATHGSHRQFKHPTKAGRVTLAGKRSDDFATGHTE
jgi:hypothetical protein